MSTAQERQWQDVSGRYRVTARLVTSDDNLVVLKKSDGELIVLNRGELSVEDRDFLMLPVDSKASKMSGDIAVAVAPAYMLDSYARSRGQEQAENRSLKLVELGLLSVNAGVTEVWEVGLHPNAPFAFHVAC